jgi:hypothetical protein
MRRLRIMATMGASFAWSPSMNGETNLSPAESILRVWLGDRDVTLFCGDWRHGGVMELLPRGEAVLSGSRYEPPFDGVRELRLRSGAHHVHLDLRRLTRVWYLIAPSVCYGFRPSFEVRLGCADADPRESFGIGLAIAHPYSGGKLRTGPVSRYLERAIAHPAMFPEMVAFQIDREAGPTGRLDVWSDVESLLAAASHPTTHGSGARLPASRRLASAANASA